MALKCVPWPKCRPYQSLEYSQYVGYLGGKSGKEHLLTWSYCPRRSQACSRREWGRVRVCHIFGSLKRPPFWQRVEQFDKELVPPPQAGLKFHHMGQRPGPTSCLQGALGAPVHPRASRPHWPSPASSRWPGCTARPLCSQEVTSPGDSGQAAERLLAMSQGTRVGAGLLPGEWVGVEMQDSREASSILGRRFSGLPFVPVPAPSGRGRGRGI